jgi:RNA polymerase subunit RPABC4/transcription elongation factor Spt4
VIEHSYDDCEHSDGDVMGKCAICGNMVCSECYRTVYNQMICSGHLDLEEESSWEVVGFYSDSDIVAEVRFELKEQGLTSLELEADADTIEIYVPPEEKEDAWESITALAGEFRSCSECQVHFSSDIGICPICGNKTPE